jgi:hypothetical protein
MEDEELKRGELRKREVVGREARMTCGKLQR